MEKFENVCEKCGKSFETEDEEEKICKDCWTKIRGTEEGKGEEK